MLMPACSRQPVNETAVPSPKPAESTVAHTNENVNEELRNRVAQIAATSKGRVGFAVMFLESGETASLNPRDRFPMQSVYKLPIGMAVMQQVDAGKIKLDQKVKITKDDFIGRDAHSPIRDSHPDGVELAVEELLGWMLKESDGTASDVLMRLAGGPSAIQAYLTELKITDMAVLDTEKAFSEDHSLQFRNWATPEAAVALLEALFERKNLSESSQALLLKLMTESRPGAKRLKGLLPAETVVAHKTGTSGTEKGVTAATNDIGIVTLPNGQHFAIAVFVADSTGNDVQREEVIAKISRAVWDSTGLTAK
jgi:beta-lactamase class A